MTPLDAAAPANELAEAADANFVVHATWVPTHVDGARVLIDPDLVLVDSGLPCDTFNFACRARLTPGDAASRVAAAIDFFRAVEHPFSWWLGPADTPPDLDRVLLDAGLERDETELAMVADLSALPPQDLSPGGLEIRRVQTEDELHDFARIAAANWTPPDPHVLAFYQLATDALLEVDAPQRLYVGYVADEPVATAELTVGGEVVQLYNISTREDYRRRGIGTALTLQPLLEAREEGYRAGVLQAAPEGVSIYTRVGFRAFGDITEYKPPAEWPAA